MSGGAIGLASVGATSVATPSGSDGSACRSSTDTRGSAVAALNLGILLERREDLKGAEGAYFRGDERGSAVATFNLGVLLKRRGDLQGAEAV